MGKRVLLTGCGGFIGAHCVRYWLEHTDWHIIGIDSFRHKGRVSRIKRMIEEGDRLPDSVWSRLTIHTHDLSVPIDPALENLLLGRCLDNRGVVTEQPLDYIINMASDSAVERSASDPTHCMRNNFELMVNMLEFTRKVKPDLFIQISTDEVYGEAPPTGPGHKEWATIMPSNPYAASKAAQEALAISYWRTYNLPIVITNTMNVIGEMQDCEKFLPRLVSCIAQNKEIPIYADKTDGPSLTNLRGRGGNHVENNQGWRIGSRVYLDARNKADALRFITQLPVPRYAEGAREPARYNICGKDELNNLELARMVAAIMGKPLRHVMTPSESARPGYDRRYALDGSLLASLGWSPPIPFGNTLQRVVQWSLRHGEWIV